MKKTIFILLFLVSLLSGCNSPGQDRDFISNVNILFISAVNANGYDLVNNGKKIEVVSFKVGEQKFGDYGSTIYGVDSYNACNEEFKKKNYPVEISSENQNYNCFIKSIGPTEMECDNAESSSCWNCHTNAYVSCLCFYVKK